MRQAAYSCGRDICHIAGELDYKTGELGRMLGPANPDDPRYFPADLLIEFMIACGEKGFDIYEYIGQRLRAAQEKTNEEMIAEAAKFIKEHGPQMAEAMKIMAGKK